MKTNIHIYYDRDSDPYNPGYVVAYDERGQRNLTQSLDALTKADALDEAALLLAVDSADIELD
jgi:hypothetical protein